MTAPIRQRVPHSVRDARAVLPPVGAALDEGDSCNRRAADAASSGLVPPDLRGAAMPDSSADLGPDEPFASPCEAAAPVAGSPAASWTGAVVDGGNEAGCTARLPHGRYVLRGLPREDQDAARRPRLSIHHRDDVAVAGLRGELDLLGACAPQAHLSDIRCQRRPRSIADLTGLAFLDCACLSVLVRHGTEICGRGGAFALAEPACPLLRILAVTGLLSWLEVHDTVEETVTGGAISRLSCHPCRPRPCGVPLADRTRSRVIPEVFMSHESVVGAGRGSRHGGGAVPAPAWLS
jgi:anti-anti-sigma factor